MTVGESIGLRRPAEILDEVIEVVSRRPDYAEEAGVDGARIATIAAEHRLDIT
ncbi:hypothetical protein SAMN03097708_00560 [Thiohalomonas denitrificans]|uniref:Uncharacterized protein n=1 Tax=Thiohalomonas denitrificans TaxID=415747 RepID=A0A1G5PRL3_9GAMM|nr:hypothetical protein SAMN03097708_00560 [Thiohalomonas denitrificans]